ncbi:hypothetical protein AALP_AA8G421000 [Arabis alpina]|uniref:RRM domain-containing protein n=1 Tax=Arabis alpina TaxID=50452 RepID=A0A087GCX0_ARAAL|nr:hypothetical protein AALP_AA8G421000 [Arabis alpina]
MLPKQKEKSYQILVNENEADEIALIDTRTDSSFALIMAIAENAGVEVDLSGRNSDENTVLEAKMKPPCPDDQNPKSETPNPESTQETSEVNLKSEISHLGFKLNPMAKEFVPQTHYGVLRDGLWFTNNFAVEAVSAKENGYFATRRRNFGQGKHRMNKNTGWPQNEDVIRRTVYVGDVDQQVTEEQLASLFLSCGQVVDCRICGDKKSVLRFAFIEFTDIEGARSALTKSGTLFGSHPIRVLLSKTAIAPVNPTFLPRSEDERQKCVKTIYCTNIDRRVTQMELEDFFQAVCGEVQHLRLLGDYRRQTRIAFIEFKLAESAIAALNCSGVVLGGLPVRVSPSKTPIRPQSDKKNPLK